MDEKKRNSVIIAASAKEPDEDDNGPDPRELAAKALLRAIEDKDYPLFLRIFDDILDMRDDKE